MDFLEALRIFSNFISSRFNDLTSISDRFICSSFLHHNGTQRANNEQSYKILCDKLIEVTKDEIKEINIKNFLFCCFYFYEHLQSVIDFDVFCKNKDNRSIYTLLTSINSQYSQMIKCDKLNQSQIDKLKIIHSDMVCKFNLKDNDVIKDLVLERVDQILAARQTGERNNSEIVNNDHNNQHVSLNNITNKHKYEFFHLKNLLNKQLRYSNHINILKIHKTKSTPTVPVSLDYTRFPMPFFNKDQKFIDKHNNLIREFQNKSIEMIQVHIEEQLSIIEDRIIQEKEKILGLSYIGLGSIQIDNIICFLRSEEEKKLTKTFMLNQRRAEKCKNEPFTLSIYNKNIESSTQNNTSVESSLNHSRFEKPTNFNYGKRVSFDDTNSYLNEEEERNYSFRKNKDQLNNRFQRKYNDSGMDSLIASSFRSSNRSSIDNDFASRTPKTNPHSNSRKYSTPSNTNDNEHKTYYGNSRTSMSGSSNSNFHMARKKYIR
jgi:hypothetical protein